jgi:hypothetical protein
MRKRDGGLDRQAGDETEHHRPHSQEETAINTPALWRTQLRGPPPARSTSIARVLATLRNLAISILRLAGVRDLTAALRSVGRDAERAAALLGA